jgi:pimeloyl-ACP methyl ester carboxylesterase
VNRTELKHARVSANGITLHVVEQGEGPLVLLCHGWPELWHSWKHQLEALAQAGFRAVAPDLRGFGESDAPADVAAYTVLHLVGDIVALVAALGEREAVMVGHDWGANVAWNAALLRPDVFRAVVAMSVPFRARGPKPPLELLRQAGMDSYYWFYFQTPGLAEAEFERDVPATLRRILYTGSGDAPPGQDLVLAVAPGGGFLDRTLDPDELPAWLPRSDLDLLAASYRRTGFRAGLNLYRNIDRNWELLAPWQGAKTEQPALFIAGTRDAVIRGPMGERALASLAQTVPGLQGTLLIDGAGHWIQRERPAEVNAALLAFLREHCSR